VAIWLQFHVHESLSERTLQKGLDAVVRDGITSQIKMTLTESIFLIAFAVALGASNAIVGLIAAIPPLAQLLQIPSIILVQRTKIRRRICVFFSAVSRLSILIMVFIPVLSPGIPGLLLLLIGVTSHAVFNAVSVAAWNSWMKDLIPQEILGRFFSKRLAIQALVGIVTTLSAGILIDQWLRSDSTSLSPYSIVFFVGMIAGLVGVYFIYTIPEPRMIIETLDQSLMVTLRRPFQDPEFRRLMVFSTSWSFAVTLAGPFFTVYLLEVLGYDLSIVAGLSVLSQVTSMLFYQWWGRLSDKYSNKTVLRVTTPIYAIGILLWIFTTVPGPYIFTLPLLLLIHVVLGLSAAAVNLAHGNLALKLAPRSESTSYLAGWSIVNSIAAVLAPLAGGVIADTLANSFLSFHLAWQGLGLSFDLGLIDIRGLDFVFLISFLVALYAIHRLAMVREAGEADQKTIIDAMVAQAGRGLRSLSTVDGLRHSIVTPLANALRPSRNHSDSTEIDQDEEMNQE
jgi:MFS family permease